MRFLGASEMLSRVLLVEELLFVMPVGVPGCHVGCQFSLCAYVLLSIQ